MTETQDDIMRRNGYLPAVEAAELAGIHYQTIHHLIKNGHVRTARAGHKWYVERRSLAEYYSEAPPIRDRILGAVQHED